MMDIKSALFIFAFVLLAANSTLPKAALPSHATVKWGVLFCGSIIAEATAAKPSCPPSSLRYGSCSASLPGINPPHVINWEPSLVAIINARVPVFFVGK